MFSAKEMLLSLASNPAAVAVETAVAVVKKAPVKVPSQRLRIEDRFSMLHFGFCGGWFFRGPHPL